MIFMIKSGSGWFKQWIKIKGEKMAVMTSEHSEAMKMPIDIALIAAADIQNMGYEADLVMIQGE
jgi:hypothetical protein